MGVYGTYSHLVLNESRGFGGWSNIGESDADDFFRTGDDLADDIVEGCRGE